MHRTFAIFSFPSGRRHLEAVVISKPDPSIIATAIGNRVDGIVLPGLYEGGRRLVAVGIDRDFADLIHARYPEGGVDDLLRLALTHPDFDARHAGDAREPFTLFETADEAVVAIMRKRDDALAGAMAALGKSR